jgi:hypothetical protein
MVLCLRALYLQGKGVGLVIRLWAGRPRSHGSIRGGGGSSTSKGRDWHWSTAKLVLSGYRGLFTWGVKLTTRLASRLRMDGAIPSLLRMLSCCVQGQRYLTPSVFPWRTICSLLLRKYYFCTEKLASVTLKQTYDVSNLLPFCLAGAARP